ncbi:MULTISPECIES: replication initiator protein A [Deinococcus]|nr:MULTISPECIES: replication initiator protein A [Deinococcus]
MKKMKHDTPVRIDERNSAALGIFSMLSRSSGERQQWHSQFTVAGRQYDVSGEAARGRPHGADVNIMVGLENLFQAQGCPTDNFVHTSANELREASLLAANGRNLQRLREGLDRIWETSITVTRGWHLPDGRTLAHVHKTRLINDLRYWVQGDPDPTAAGSVMVPGATLSIQLGAHLADSIRAGYTQNLQLEILRRIEQPPARTLYRLLEAHRYNPDGTAREELTVDLDNWRHACGLGDNRRSRHLRTLEQPHEELIAQHYLQDVTVDERGARTTLLYRFRNPDAPDPELVQMLVRAGVAQNAATQLARQYPDRIEASVRLSRELQRTSTILKPGAFTRDIVEHPEKYPWPEPAAPVPAPRRAQQAAEERAREEEAREQQRRAELEAADPQTQWKTNAPALRFYLKKDLTAAQWTTLEGDCLSGQRSSLELLNTLVAAQANLTLQSVIHDLKENLG